MKNKKHKKSRIIFLLFLIIVISTIIGIHFINNKEENTKIVATKTVTEDDGKEIITYTIKIKESNLESVVKEIECETKEKAELEYRRYEIINKAELKGYQLELKDNKVIVIIPEKQFKLDIEYKDEYNIIHISSDNKETEILNQEKVKELLYKQNYAIK